VSLVAYTVLVAALTATAVVEPPAPLGPVGIAPGVCPHPVLMLALHVLPLNTPTRFSPPSVVIVAR
jgi:hypothetical protein